TGSRYCRIIKLPASIYLASHILWRRPSRYQALADCATGEARPFEVRRELSGAVGGKGAVRLLRLSRRTMGDRHAHATWTARGLDLGIEMLCKGHDKACAQAAFAGRCFAGRHSDAVVGDGELPIGARNFVADNYFAISPVVDEWVLQGVDHKFCDDEA